MIIRLLGVLWASIVVVVSFVIENEFFPLMGLIAYLCTREALSVCTSRFFLPDRVCLLFNEAVRAFT